MTKDLANQEAAQLQELRDRQEALRSRFEQLIAEERLELLEQLVVDVEQLQRTLEAKAAELDRAIGRGDQAATPEQILQETLTQTTRAAAGERRLFGQLRKWPCPDPH